MSRPVRTFITLLGLWLLGACEKPTAAPPPAAARSVQAPAGLYFGRPADGKLHVYQDTSVLHGKARYMASRKSELFHLVECPTSQRIKDENRIYFTTREQAADGNTRRPSKDWHP